MFKKYIRRNEEQVSGCQKVGGIAVAITGHGETKEQMECYKALHVIEPCRTKYTHAHVHTQLGRRGSVSGFDIQPYESFPSGETGWRVHGILSALCLITTCESTMISKQKAY